MNSKIFRNYSEADEKYLLRDISRFNKELYLFEKIDRAEDYPFRLDRRSAVDKSKLKPFKTVKDIKRGDNLEA